MAVHPRSPGEVNRERSEYRRTLPGLTLLLALVRVRVGALAGWRIVRADAVLVDSQRPMLRFDMSLVWHRPDLRNFPETVMLVTRNFSSY